MKFPTPPIAVPAVLAILVIIVGVLRHYGAFP
jgi:hypothetical protein